MPFPTRQQTDDGWDSARDEATALKAALTTYNATMAAQSVSVRFVVNVMTRLITVRQTFTDIAAIPGIVAYARDRLNDQSRDIGAEFQAMSNSCRDAALWIVDNIPKDGNNRLLERTISAQGLVNDVMLSTAQTAGLRAQLQAVIDTIE